MLFGHLAMGFAAKPLAPKVPLLVLLFASMFIDLLSFAFMAAGIENAGVSQTTLEHGVVLLIQPSIPWSHGLFMAIVWSLLAAAAGLLFFRDRWAGAVLGLVAFSHWALDFIVHVGDLPLMFDSSQAVGLGLWGSGPGLIVSAILELALVAGGLAVYLNWRNRNKKLITPECPVR